MLLAEEVVAEIFSTDHEPKALSRHEVVRVHLILCVLLIPFNFLEIVDDAHIYLQILLVFFLCGLLPIIPFGPVLCGSLFVAIWFLPQFIVL